MAETANVPKVVTPIPSPPITKWWNDPSKLIPIIISLLALCISCLSWWESHRSRILNEGVNRPILILDSTDPSYGGPSSSDGIYISFGAKLKNVGKTTAIIQAFEVYPAYFRGRNDECKFEDVRSNKTSQPASPEILPGMERMIYGGTLVYPGCDKSLLHFNVIINITYSDESGKYYIQNFGAATEVSLDELKKKHEEIKQLDQ